jgi:hypothetical protein
MVFQKLSLSLLTALLLLSFASASLTLTASPSVVSADPGNSVSLNLVINNTANVSLTGLTWSKSVVGSDGSNFDISSLPDHIDANTAFTNILTFSVPQSASGQINASVSASNSSVTLSSTKFSINVANAPSLTITKVSELTKTQSGKVTVTNTGNNNLNVLMSASISGVTFSPSAFTLAAGDSKDVVVTATDISGLNFGDSITVTASATGAQSQSLTFSSLTKGFCSNGDVGGNLSIRNVDISSTGDKDKEWRFLDTITVEVEVEDISKIDVDSVTAEIGLFDSSGANVINDVDFVSSDKETYDIGDLSDGDRETATFEFTIPADMNSGSYKLAVKAYSDDLGESTECTDTSSDLSNKYYQTITVKKETDKGRFIAFNNIVVNPQEASCDDTVTLTTTVYNVGDKDQSRVRVNLANSELGLDQSYEIKNLDQGDNKKLTFTFSVPSTAADKAYKLALSADYEYRNGDYDQSSDEDTVQSFTVQGCAPTTPTTQQNAQITASLDTNAVAGQPMTVSATIKNVGTKAGTFLVNVRGFESWAALSSISDRSLTLGPGESQTVELNFNINKAATGEQSFIIEASSNGNTETREVAVTLEKSTSSVGNIFQGNSLAWIIGIINVVLIILIIIIAIRVARK